MKFRITIALIIISLLIVFGILIFMLFFQSYIKDDKDFCLDKGGCWDYIRNKCEMTNQGFCVKNSDDCINVWNGKWNSDKLYCEFIK